MAEWDTLTMFEATVCGRSWVQSPTGEINYSRMRFSSDQVTGKVFSFEHAFPSKYWIYLEHCLVCGRSWVQSPTGANSKLNFSSDQVTGKVFSSEHAFPSKIRNLFWTLSSWESSNYRPSAPFLYEVASHVKTAIPAIIIIIIIIIIISQNKPITGLAGYCQYIEYIQR